VNPDEKAQGLTQAERKSVARIESFSDIVFAFSLFNLALNLRAPTTPSEFLAQIPLFVVFIGTFGILCEVWWLHHRLFRDFFVPDRVGINLNFALLASVAMFSYPLQLYFRFGWLNPFTLAGYAAGALLVYGLMAILFWKGVRSLSGSLVPQLRADGRSLTLRLGILAIGMLVALALYRVGPIAMIIIIGIAAAVSASLEERRRRRSAY